MQLKDFIRKCIQHVALAMTVWLLIVLAIERLIPGFATPFVDLPGIGLLTFGVTILAIALV